MDFLALDWSFALWDWRMEAKHRQPKT